MSTLCDTTCGGAAAIPTPYDDACAPERRQHGANYFILARCDVKIDMEDGGIAAGDGSATAYNVAGAVAAGVLEISPKGKLIKGSAEVETIENAYGCGQSIPGAITIPFTYETYNTTGCESAADYLYWKNLFDDYQSFRVMWVDCCGFLHYNATDNSTANPGYEFSVTTPPEFIEGDANLGKWNFAFEITGTELFDTYYDAVNTPLILAELGISV